MTASGTAARSFHPAARRVTTGPLVDVDADHLDWHGSVAAYREAKHRIFENQEPTDVAVVPPRWRS